MSEDIHTPSVEGAACTLAEDCAVPGQYRVEAFDEDGTLELSIFSGPRALERALDFVGRTSPQPFYASWDDPQGLAGY